MHIISLLGMDLHSLLKREVDILIHIILMAVFSFSREVIVWSFLSFFFS